MFEIEQFKNEETGQMLNTEIMWRNRTFYVKVMNIEEAADLQSCLYIEGEQEEPEIWDFESFEACEMDSTFDGSSEDFVFYGHHFTEEQQDALNEEYDEQMESDDWVSRYEFLEEKGFDSWGCNWQVHGGIEAVESDHEVYV